MAQKNCVPTLIKKHFVAKMLAIIWALVSCNLIAVVTSQITLTQWSPTFLAPGTFHGRQFFRGLGAGASFEMIQAQGWRRQWHPTPVLLPGKSHGGAWKAAVHGVAESRTRLSDFTFTFHFHALEKEMATHSSVLAWRIPGTGEPGGLPSVGLHRVGHDWSDLAVSKHMTFIVHFISVITTSSPPQIIRHY